MTARLHNLASARVQWSVFGVIAFLSCALWLLPLSVLIWPVGSQGAGVAARTVDGTAWNGRLLNATVMGAQAGDITVSLTPAAVLKGQMRFRLGSLSTQAISGDAFAGLAGRGVNNLDARFVPGGAIQDLGVTAARTTSLSLLFRGGECTEASGQLTAYLGGNALSRLAGTQLSGPATCVNGELSFRLTDPDGKAVLSLEYPKIKAAGFTLILRPGDARDKAALQAMGFSETPVGFRRSGMLPR